MDHPDRDTVAPLIERLGWLAVELPVASAREGTFVFTAMPLADLQLAGGTEGTTPGRPVPRLEGRGATPGEALY